MAVKTFKASGSADSMVKSLSQLQYSSDFLKDDLGGNSSYITDKALSKKVNWKPKVNTAHPMAYFRFSGTIKTYSIPGNELYGHVIKGNWDKDVKSSDNRESNGLQTVEMETLTQITEWIMPSAGGGYRVPKNKAVQIVTHKTEQHGGIGVYKYIKIKDNLYLYCVVTLHEVYPKENKSKTITEKFWVQVTGKTETSYAEYSAIFDNIKAAESTAKANSPNQDIIGVMETDPNNPDAVDDENGDGNGGGSSEQDLYNWADPNADYSYENNKEYYENLIDSDKAYQKEYWDMLYGSNTEYSLKSHNSIIGLPLQFMGNVDFRPGESNYGKQFLEDIIYDMNIACIKPGGPVLNPKFSKDAEYSDDTISTIVDKYGELKGYFSELKEKGAGEFLQECLFTMFKGSSARFYSFMSDYTHYTHYVNTLCHLFITFLGIGDKEYVNAVGDVKTYSDYTDDYKEIESDKGLGLKNQFGFDNAVYLYYSDESSSLNQNFSNSTMQSGLADTVQEASKAVKEWGFLINAAGIESGKGIIALDNIAATASTNGGVLGRLLSNATEGATTILAGNNVSLPEIYADSDTTVEHTFKVKLASPYGDPESIFLYVLRPLARMLAFSLPRQYGANSYTSPFIVQAFSKGQFNCQLGIVTNLSVTRCGNGGESHSINHIPTELEVNITIADMYDKIFLSNEYFGNGPFKSIAGAFVDHITDSSVGSTVAQFLSTNTAAKLLFNNVGLIDFAASFCGFNLNMPTYMDGWEMISTMMKNRCAEFATYSENNGWMFPQWEKRLNDSMNDAVTRLTTPLVTIAN